MDELEREYTLLFNGITDAIRQLERMQNRLAKLQQDAEELYLNRIGNGETLGNNADAHIQPQNDVPPFDEE